MSLTSSDASVLRLAPNATTAGTATISIPVAAGQGSFAYVVQGVEGAAGLSATVTASAPGFTDSAPAAVNVVQPALMLFGLPTSTTALSPNDAFGVRIGLPSGSPPTSVNAQAIRTGGTAGLDQGLRPGSRKCVGGRRPLA